MHTTLSLWQRCLASLEQHIEEKSLNTWLRPLQAIENGSRLRLLAPNPFVRDRVKKYYFDQIQQEITALTQPNRLTVTLEIGSQANEEPKKTPASAPKIIPRQEQKQPHRNQLNPDFNFDNFVEGKSNRLARAACMQVASNPGNRGSNPLFLYGGTGLGKTHLMHAVGNALQEGNGKTRVGYLHAEQFVSHMVNALQHNAMARFKEYYRSLDALLVDDIQFFAGKGRSQEEFFYTFNRLLEEHQQIILTSDRYPKEVRGLDNRLKSRFGWGLTVCIEAPDLETRVAILKSKAQQNAIELSDEVAFFIADGIQSNIRELEGALRRVYAQAQFIQQPISVDLAREALHDVMNIHAQTINVEGIQQTVADYYKLRLQDLLSSTRQRSIARPRQIAMALTKELTSHSLPEIGEAFGKRDHTTVLHACRTIEELLKRDSRLHGEYEALRNRLLD